MSQRGGNEASGGGGTVVSEFVKGHAGTFAGEHENQGTYKLSKRRFKSVGSSRLLGPSKGDVADRHGRLIKDQINGGELESLLLRATAVYPQLVSTSHSGSHLYRKCHEPSNWL